MSAGERWRVCPACGHRAKGPLGMTHDTSDHGPVAMLPYVGREPEKTLDELEATVERLAPYLTKDEWAPITSMLIPGMLKTTDETLAKLRAYAGPERERAGALLGRLAALLAEFHRLSEGRRARRASQHMQGEGNHGTNADS